jgi:hypothetical protein
MKRFGDNRRSSWVEHVSFALEVIPPVRRFAYLYTLLLLVALVGATFDDYRELARRHQVKARAALQVVQPE